MPDAPLIAEATRWRILLPAGVLKGITEADAYRLAAEYHVRPDRAWVRLYADGTEELGPWSPAPMLPRRLRTQAERDADGTTWHPGGVVNGSPAHVELDRDECVLVAREGVGLMCVRADHDHSLIVGDFGPVPEPPRPPRRRWWHRYTRRAQ